MNIGVSGGLGLLIAFMVGAIITGHIGWIIAAIGIVIASALIDAMD